MPENIAQWLAAHGLGKYADSFAGNGVDFDVLAQLSDADLKELGLNLGDRRRLQALIKTLADEDGTGGAEIASTGEATRGQVTVVFCDLVGSTQLSTLLDPEELLELTGAYQAACAKVVARYDGFIARYMGDGILIYFGYPNAHENDAERAIETGLEIVAAVQRLEQDLSVRVGIATGEVVVGDVIGDGAAQEAAITGETPNLAARLQAIAEPNTVMVAATTHALAGGLFQYSDLGERDLKGFSDPVHIWSVSGSRRTESRFDATHLENLTKFVGREDEIEIFSRCWARSIAGDRQLVLITGEPGIGKSRIVQRFREQTAAALPAVVVLQCSPHHANGALYPFVEQASFDIGLVPDDSNQIRLAKLVAWIGLAGQSAEDNAPLFGSILGVDAEPEYSSPQLPPREQKKMIFGAFIDRAVKLSATRPMIFVMEDAHWIDPTSMELLNLHIEQLADCPAMIVVTYRPEFEAPWVGQSNTSILVLGRLNQAQCTELAMDVSRRGILPEETINQIAERTDGVPLFVEELTKSIIENAGAFMDGRAENAIPETLRDSLEFRLDRLGPAKRIAQIGATIGRSFDYALLSEVSSMDQAELDAGLTRLVSSGLVLESGRPPDAKYTFKHALVQDTAYGSVLKRERRSLHDRIANVLAADFPLLAASEPEIVAHHYSEAGAAAEAITYWRRAGEQAAAYWNHAEAVDYFELCIQNITDLQQTDDIRLLGAELELATAYSLRGINRYQDALSKLKISEAGAKALNEPLILARIHLLRGNLYFPLGRLDECQLEHEKAQKFAREGGLAELEARALGGLGDAAYAQGKMKTARTNFHQCMELSLANGLDEIYAVNLAMAALSGFWRLPMQTVLEESINAVDVARQGEHIRAEIIACQGVNLAASELNDFKIARQYVDRSLILSEQIRAHRFSSQTLAYLSRLNRLEGRRGDAGDFARQALDLSRKVGMAFIGPVVLIELAATTENADERNSALRGGEEILAAGCPIHNHSMFYRSAIDLALELEMWDEAVRYADALLNHPTAEPSSFHDFHAGRARLLAAFERGGRGSEITKSLERAIEEGAVLGQNLGLPKLENALKDCR